MSGLNPTPSRTPKGYQPYLFNAYQPSMEPTDQRVERKAVRDIRDLQEMNRRHQDYRGRRGGDEEDSEEGMPLSPLPHQSQGDWRQKMCLRVIFGSACTVSVVVLVFAFWYYLWTYFV